MPRPNGYTVRILPIAANDIVWDSVHSLIYASVRAGAPANASTMVAIDPATGAIVGSTAVGGEPGKLAVSADGQYLFVARNDLSVVERLGLPNLTTNATLVLPSDPHFGPVVATDIEVAPGTAATVAILLGLAGNPREPDGVVVFDDTAMRPAIAAPRSPQITPLIDHIQWSASSSRLYGVGINGNLQQLYSITVDSNGPAITNTLNVSADTGIHFLNGLLYTDAATVYDPATGLLVATLANTTQYGFAVPDAALAKIFWLGDNSGGVYNYIQSYDLTSYAPVKSLTIIGPSLSLYAPTPFITWGANGLAFASSDGSVVLINGAFLGP
jgi:hypothetical protein